MRMSLTITLYDPEICDGHYCCKDCDECAPWADMVLEKIAEEGEQQ